MERILGAPGVLIYRLVYTVAADGPSAERSMINLGIFRHSDTQTFQAGQVIFQAGEPGTVMYVVSDGTVDIFVDSILLETAGAGSVIGEMALIDHGPRSASAKAKTDCKLVVVDQKRFEFLVSQTPFFAIEVMQIMADRLRRADKLVSNLASESKKG